MMDREYRELEALVEAWGHQKGILESSTSLLQTTKTLEELSELQKAIIVRDKEEIKDAIGDVMVTLILASKLEGLSILECLEHSYGVISGRKGAMVDGVFVKED